MNVKRLLILFILTMEYAGCMLASTDFTTRSQLNTDVCDQSGYADINNNSNSYLTTGDSFTYLGLSYRVNEDSECCTVTGCSDDLMTTLKIPEIAVDVDGIQYKVTTIADSAFLFCGGLTGDLVIPNSVVMIGKRAFQRCSGFDGRLILGNSVETIDECAFLGCDGLTGNLIIPNSVKFINAGVFIDCRGFSGDLIIPNSVKSIGWAAFEGCSGFDGTLTLSNSIETIGREVFSDCNGLTGDLVIPNSVKYIEEVAFNGCSGFDGKLTLSNSLETIGGGSFLGCKGLTGDLVIPNSVKFIGLWAFIDCSNFASKSCLAIEPPTLGDEAFDEGSTIYVLPGSLDKYKADEQWAKYILEVDQSGIESISDGNAIKVNGRSVEAPAGSRVINLSGIEVGDRNLAPGTYIVVVPDGRTQKVVIK